MKLSKKSLEAARRVAEIVEKWQEEHEYPDEWDLREAMDYWHNSLASRRHGVDWGRLEEIKDSIEEHGDKELKALAARADELHNNDEYAYGNSLLEGVLTRGDLYTLGYEDGNIAVGSLTFDYNEPMDGDTWNKIREIFEEALTAQTGLFLLDLGLEAEADEFAEAFNEAVNEYLPEYGVTFDVKMPPMVWVYVEEDVIHVYLDTKTLKKVLKNELPKPVDVSDRKVMEIGNDSIGRYDVFDLLPEHLPYEGMTQGICIGDPGMGYMRAVENGELRVLSVRTKKGRPKFTVSLNLDENGDVVDVDQVKGKANRLPGFTGRDKIKESELLVLSELFENLGVDPWDVEDMVPGLRALKKETRENPRRSFDEPYRRRRNPSHPTPARSFDEPYRRRRNPGHPTPARSFDRPYGRRR